VIERLRFWWRMRLVGASIGIPMDGSRRVWLDGRTLTADRIEWEVTRDGRHIIHIVLENDAMRERNKAIAEWQKEL